MHYRTGTKKAPNRFLSRTVAVLIACAGVSCLYVIASGLLGGEITVLSRRLDPISLSSDPFWFLVTLLGWSVLGIALLRLALRGWREG